MDSGRPEAPRRKRESRGQDGQKTHSNPSPRLHMQQRGIHGSLRALSSFTTIQLRQPRGAPKAYTTHTPWGHFAENPWIDHPNMWSALSHMGR